MKSVIAALMLAFAALSTSTPVRGQDLLQPGQSVTGAAGRGSCYLLPTVSGSRWRLHGTASIIMQVGRGTCENLTVDRSGYTNNIISSNFRLDFAAGGGGYIVRIQSMDGVAWGYSIRAELLPGVATSGLLPAAAAIPSWFNAGWTPPSVSASPTNAGEGLSRGNVFKDCADVCPELVVVPAGAFTMGSPDNEAGHSAYEAPRHPVAFAHAFAIGRNEVTFDEFDACVADGGCSHRPNDQGWGRGRRPVVDVSWNDTQAYVVWLSEKTGHRYALPSEAEWEYAARAGTDRPWHTGAALLTADANILNSFARTVAVGAYPPNAFGLHDVHGNVGEWTLDCLDTGYVGVPNDGAAATAGDCAQKRVVRSGSFKLEPVAVRSAQRAVAPQISRHDSIGFRVTRAL